MYSSQLGVTGSRNITCSLLQLIFQRGEKHVGEQEEHGAARKLTAATGSIKCSPSGSKWPCDQTPQLLNLEVLS